MTPRTFVDACVLFPPLVRRITLGAAARGLIIPLWSPRVLDEWRISSLAKSIEPEDAVLQAQAEMAVAFADASIISEDTHQTPELPDPGDIHVLSAAIAGHADVLLTFNLRDFPRRALAGFGIEPRHPDDLLWQLFSIDPDLMGDAITQALTTTSITETKARASLKRARLPRLGKAFEAEIDG